MGLDKSKKHIANVRDPSKFSYNILFRTKNYY